MLTRHSRALSWLAGHARLELRRQPKLVSFRLSSSIKIATKQFDSTRLPFQTPNIAIPSPLQMEVGASAIMTTQTQD